MVREHHPQALLVGVAVDLPEARRRSTTRPVWSTEQEIIDLQRQDAAAPPSVNVTLDVAAMDAKAQQASVEVVWAAGT